MPVGSQYQVDDAALARGQWHWPQHTHHARSLPSTRTGGLGGAGCSITPARSAAILCAADLRHPEQVVDHLGEPDRFLLNVFGVVAHLVIADYAVGDRPGYRADTGQRYVQIMTEESHQPSP
jgi:hypothetical protein